MTDNNNQRPKKLSSALLAMFDPKKKQEKQKEEQEKEKEKQPIKVDNNQVNKINERFDKMLEEKNKKEENKKNEIQTTNQINNQKNNNNLVKDTLDQFSKKTGRRKTKTNSRRKRKS